MADLKLVHDRDEAARLVGVHAAPRVPDDVYLDDLRAIADGVREGRISEDEWVLRHGFVRLSNPNDPMRKDADDEGWEFLPQTVILALAETRAAGLDVETALLKVYESGHAMLVAKLLTLIAEHGPLNARPHVMELLATSDV